MRWHGVSTSPDLSYSSHALAFFLRRASLDDSDLYVMISCYWQDLDFSVAEGEAHEWFRAVDTSSESPDDILEFERQEPLPSVHYTVRARSVVILVRR